MMIWLEDTFGPDNAMYIVWATAALIALIVLLVAWRLFRGTRSGTFVSGGRNRKARLAVMDATAIDTHRRLVLVRRDDVEHLILIGGNSDIVVESNILPVPSTTGLEVRKPAVEPALEPAVEPAPPTTPPRPAPQPTAAPLRATPEPQYIPPPPTRAVEPAPSRPAVTPASAPASTIEPAPRYRTAPLTAPESLRSASLAPHIPPATPPAEKLDTDLLRELESAMDIDPSPRSEPPKVERPRATLDDEMSRLLGELSSQKR